MNKVECFKIRIFALDRKPFQNFEKAHFIHQILCDKWKLTSAPLMIAADPFLFRYRNRLFLFYEQKHLYQPGRIAMISTENLRNWTKPQIVLQEDFHLSYPYVFEDNGHIYMMPESCADKSIRLYEADDRNLICFSFKKKLLWENNDAEPADISFSDSSVFYQDGIYYLNTTVAYGGVNQLRLFVSDSLLGNWREHPCSPILNSSKYGRNAGCWLTNNHKLFRVAQDCENGYGNNVHVFQIDELSELTYKEHLIYESVYSPKTSFYKNGGHHLNIIQFNGKTIVATDAKEYHGYVVNRALHKLGRYGN